MAKTLFQFIENLEELTRLKSLSLRNNVIRKLEKLDHLIALKELNVSENLLEKIEGQFMDHTFISFSSTQLKHPPNTSL